MSKVLDEATSALDVNTEKLLYAMLVERGVAVISYLHVLAHACICLHNLSQAFSF